jgi:hypothetical protein
LKLDGKPRKWELGNTQQRLKTLLHDWYRNKQTTINFVCTSGYMEKPAILGTRGRS